MFVSWEDKHRKHQLFKTANCILTKCSIAISADDYFASRFGWVSSMTIRTIDYQSQSSSLKETHNAASLLLHGKCVQVCISSLPPVPDCITTHSNLFFWWFVNQHGCLQSSWLVFFNVFYLCVYLLFLPFLFSFFFCMWSQWHISEVVAGFFLFFFV